MKTILKIAPLCALPLLLAACGGAGNDSAAQAPRAPMAAATTTQSTAVAADYKPLLQQVYVAYFGRPADPAGLDFYTQRYLEAGAPLKLADMYAAYGGNPQLKALIDSFANSDESAALYPGNDETFVTAIYRNLFNRDPDSAGQAFWVGKIHSGELTRAGTALAIMAGAQTSDSATISSKLSVATTFTTGLNTALRANSYDGMAATAEARSVLARVDQATDLAAYNEVLETSVAGMVAQNTRPGAYLYAGTNRITGSRDGIGSIAGFGHLDFAGAFAAGKNGIIYVADRDNHFIRKVSAAGMVSNIAGSAGLPGTTDGAGVTTHLTLPSGIATDGAETYYIGGYNTIRKIFPAGDVRTIAGEPGIEGSSDGAGKAAHFGDISAMLIDPAGNVYVSDYLEASGTAIRKVTPTGTVSTVARIATFSEGLAMDAAGNLYVPDYTNSVILKIAPGGAVTVFAGRSGEPGSIDGALDEARFNGPGGITIDPNGNLYVMETDGAMIRKIAPDGMVSTVAGTPGLNKVAGYSALPGVLPKAWAITWVAPNTLVINALAGLVKVVLPN